MCGIAGIVRFDARPIDRDRLGAMLGHCRHRGPDGEGVWADDHCGLVHSRLSIIDLLSGAQPMHLPRQGSLGPLHLVFNGEVYNHRDLRTKLERRGHAFRSDHSDTEVLLLGYREWGVRLPKHLHGMFAFAIWDADQRTLFLARDRTGKKPLYVRQRPGEVAFASLVGTLAADPGGGERQPDPEALRSYLRLGYPLARSMLRGIEEVAPAHWMRIGPDGRLTTDRYWRPPPVSRSSTSLGAVDSLREVLTEAVHSRLEADVPLGCFLSGGIDSSVVAAVAQRRLEAMGGGRLLTFSVAMPEIAYDESAHARAVAQHIGAEHTVLHAESPGVMADLERLMRVAGEPTADSSLLPTFWLCRATRRHVKAALSGDGGDELFGGYDRYRALRLLRRHRWWVRLTPAGVLDRPGPKSAGHRLARLVRAAQAGPDPARQYRSMIHLFTQRQLAELAPELFAPGGEADPPLPDWPDIDDRVHAAMRWDLTHYLPHEVLRKVDRASMAVALEVRCPLLDTQVADLAGHLPTSVLMPGGRPKGLLRALAAEMLPLTIVNRPKQGFALPIGSWFRDTLREPLREHVLGDDLADLGLERGPIRRMLDEHHDETVDHTHRLFALLQLALWRRWLRAPAPPPVESAAPA